MDGINQDATPMHACLGFDGTEPYPIAQHVFDKLVEKYISNGTLTEREQAVFDYIKDVNEVALAERKLALIETVEDLDISEQELVELGLSKAATPGEDGHPGHAAADPYWWKEHDGGECPVSPDTKVFVCLRGCGGVAHPWLFHADAVSWKWENDFSPGNNVVGYRLARPDEVKW